MGLAAGGNGNNRWEREGKENKTWLNEAAGMESHWTWEGVGLKDILTHL